MAFSLPSQVASSPTALLNGAANLNILGAPLIMWLGNIAILGGVIGLGVYGTRKAIEKITQG